jgi:hypothetical protein
LRSLIKTLPVLFVGLFLCSLVFASPAAGTVGPGGVVQQNSGNLSGSSISLPFVSAVTSGDVVVVAIDVTSSTSNVVTSVTDTLGTAYVEPAASPSLLAASDGGAFLFYGALAASGSDTITVHLSVLSSSAVYIFEVTGVTTTGVTSGAGNSGAGTTASVSTASASAPNGGFMIETVQTLGADTFTAGGGFTAVARPSGDVFGLAEYGTTSVSSSTTFPMTLGTADKWDAVGLVLPLKPTVTPTVVSLPPVIPSTLSFNFNFQGAPTFSGRLVSLYGNGILYNVPGYNSTTDVFPYVLSFCSVPGTDEILISGFGSAGPGNNSSEIFVSNWTSALTSSQGWPAEPACVS